MNRQTSPAESAAQEPAGTVIEGIELVLRQIIQAVSEGHDDRVGPLVDQLGSLFESLTPADKSEPEEAVVRIQSLWKQATLAIASASHEASTELQRIALGRTGLRAYRFLTSPLQRPSFPRSPHLP